MAIKFLSKPNLSTVTAGSILKVDSNGDIVAATAGTDYVATSPWTEQNSGTLYTNKKVGIGYNDAGAKLHVYEYQTTTPKILIEDGNTGDASMQFKISTQQYTMGIDNSNADKFIIAASSALGTTNALEIDTNKKITVPADTSNGAVRFEIGGYNRLRFNGGVDLIGYTSDHLWVIGNSGTNTINLGGDWDWDKQVAISYQPNTVGNAGGIMILGQTEKNNANWTHGITAFHTNGAERIRIDSSGNVGIGTTSPSEKLHVVGNGVFHSGANLGRIKVGRSANQEIEIYVDDTNNIITAYQDSDGDSSHVFALDREFDGSGANYFEIRKGGSAQMHIDTSGNVGIGTTSPSQKLHVVGKALITDDVQLTGSNPRIDFNSNGASSLRFYDTTNALERMRINQDGNVGIGDSSPSFILDVINTSSRVRFKAATGDSNLELSAIAGRDWLIQSKADGEFRIYDEDAAAVRFNIDTSGNVGIGTTSASYKLDVAGDINTNSALRINGLSANATDIYGLYSYSSSTTRTSTSNANTEWIKVIGTTNAKRIKLKLSHSGDNTNCWDEFLIAHSTYGFKHHIQRLPGGRYNGSKVLAVLTTTTTNTTHEVWVKVQAMSSGSGVFSWRSNVPVLTGTEAAATITTTKPTMSTGGTELDTSTTDRDTYTVMTSRGIYSRSDIQAANYLATEDDYGLKLRGRDDVTHKIYYHSNDSANVWEANSEIIFRDYNSGTPLDRFTFEQDGSLQLNAYGAGLLRTNAAGAVTVDTSNYVTDVDWSDIASINGTININSTTQIGQGDTETLVSFQNSGTERGRFEVDDSADSYFVATGFKTTGSSTGLLKSDGTIDTSTYATSADINNFIEISDVGTYLSTNNYITNSTSLDVQVGNWLSVNKGGASTTTQEAGIRWQYNGTTQYWFYTDNGNNGDLRLQAAGISGESDNTPRLIIPRTNKDLYLGVSGGKVGIGTTSPDQTLSVAGDISAEDQISVNNRTAISVAHWSSSGSSTGAIKITIPGSHSSNWSMIVLRITAYEYNSTAHTIYYVSGHDWTSGWYNNGVTKIGNSNKDIQLAYDSNKDYVILGGTSSTWSYGHVTVDVMAHPGFYSGNMDITSGWAISQVTSLSGITTQSVTNKRVLTTSDEGSGNGIDADTVDGIQAASFLRSDANDTATGNLTFSGAATFTSSSLHLSGHYYQKFHSGTTNYIHFYPNAHSGNASVTYMRAWTGSSFRALKIQGDSNNITWGSHTLWTSGNDGSGSGLDADLLDGNHASDFVAVTGDTMTGTLKLDAELQFLRGGTEYSDYIRAANYPSEGYTSSSSKYWIEYGSKGGHHFVVNTDGGAGSSENSFDDFTIWQGAVDGDRLFEVTNVGNVNMTGKLRIDTRLQIGDDTSSSTDYIYDGYADANSAYFHQPKVIIRSDSAATGGIDEAPVALAMFNRNGTNDTWVKMSFASREVNGAGNTVSIAGIAAQKTTGTNGNWASGKLYLWTKNGASFVENMVLQPNGNVGVGTSSPGYKLDVAGTIRSGTGYRTSINGDGSGAVVLFGSASDNDSLGVVGAYASLFNISSGNGDISFQFNNTERMRLNSTGNLGIGTTSPGGRLELNGSGQSWTTATAIRMWDSHNSKGWLVGSANNVTAGDFYIRTLPGEDTNPSLTNQKEFVIKHSTGNVGINNLSPSYKLHVNGDIGIDSSNALIFDGNNSVGQSYVKSGGDLNLIIDSNNNQNTAALIVEKDTQTAGSGTELFRVQEDGNVGIGTASPSSLLELSSATPPTLTLTHDGTNPSTNELLSSIDFDVDYDGSHQNWGKIELKTNASSVRTDMRFYVKSTSGNLQEALLLQGGSANPKAFFTNAVDVNGSITGSTLYTEGSVINSSLALELRSDVQHGQGDEDAVISFKQSTTELAKIDQDGYVHATGFKTSGTTGFLKSDGSVDTSTYASSTHNHNSDYVSIDGGYVDSDFSWDGTHDFMSEIKVSGASATTTNTTALFYGTGGLVEKRDLGTLAFDSTTLGTAASSAATDFVAVSGDTMTGALTITNSSTGLLVDSEGHASLRVDRGSTSYDNNLLYYTAGSLKWRMWMDGSDDYLYIRDEVNSSNMVTFRKGGNVGIGTTLPSKKLHVEGDSLFDGNVLVGSTYTQPSGSGWTTSNSQLILGGAHNAEVNNDNPGVKLLITGYDNDLSTAIYPIYAEDENGTVDFWIKNRQGASSSPTMYFAGNVGIGTTSPGGNLHLQGNFESGKALVIKGTYGTDTEYYFRTHGTNSEYLALYAAGVRVMNWNSGRIDTYKGLHILGGDITTDSNNAITLNSSIQVGQGDEDPIVEFKHNGTQLGKFDQAGYLYATGFKTSGTTGFLRSDGSVDTNSYANAADFLALSGGTMTGDLTIPSKIIHSGDTNTFFQFNTDEILFATGGGITFKVNTTNVFAYKDLIVAGGETISLGERAEADDNGRTVLIEGAANATSGEGSGRIFFSEHNSTSAAADSYGLSLYYEGDPNVALPSGFQPNTGNATWSLRRHDNSVNGTPIFFGSRSNSNVTFEGTLSVPEYIYHRGDANTYIRLLTDRIQIVAGGTTKFDTSNTYLLQSSNITVRNITARDIVSESDRTYSLGTDANRWAVVFCETLDSAGQHESKLQNPEGETPISEYDTGTVLVWKGGKNVPCTTAVDHMRMGIAVKGIDSPLVQGAEPVLCTGDVKEGDYLVTSTTEGHAEAISPEYMRQHMLFDCVIGKALESGNGDSHLIKTWINI